MKNFFFGTDISSWILTAIYPSFNYPGSTVYWFNNRSVVRYLTISKSGTVLEDHSRSN